MSMKEPQQARQAKHGIPEGDMGGNRSFGKVGNDSPHDIQRAGGSDPRRPMAKIAIDRVVTNHDQSGYNHAYTPNSDSYARKAESKAMGMGTPNPDGTYSR
jgi:hypothetical protein